MQNGHAPNAQNALEFTILLHTINEQNYFVVGNPDIRERKTFHAENNKYCSFFSHFRRSILLSHVRLIVFKTLRHLRR
jgi:hypothetical protein